MKVQKLGLVLGMNMAVACMMMQGCKANKAKTDLPPDTTTVVAPASANATMTTTAADGSAVATTTSLAPTATTPTTTSPDGLPSGVVIEPAPAQPVATPVATQPSASTYVPPAAMPSKVAKIKPLPPVGKPTPVAKRPVAKTAAQISAPTSAQVSTPAGATPTTVAPIAPATSAATGYVYTVKPGDQLFAVSRKYNVRMSAIVKANPGLNPDRIRVGQKIVIPGAVATSAVAVAAAAPAATQSAPTTMQASAPAPTVTAANIAAPLKMKPSFKAYVGPTKEYKVQPGDSLSKIAYDNGITIRALMELNKMTKDSVRAGSTLLIPAEKVVSTAKAAPATVKTASAETKKTDATKADAAKKPAPAAKAEPKTEKKDAAAEVKAAPEQKEPAPEAKKADEKKDAQPKVDAPEEKKGEGAEQPKIEEPAAAPVAASGNTYTVKEGDDLVSVSIACGVGPSQLMDLNGLKAGDAIKPGQVLKLPAGAKPNVE